MLPKQPFRKHFLLMEDDHSGGATTGGDMSLQWMCHRGRDVIVGACCQGRCHHRLIEWRMEVLRFEDERKF